jgi:hypothetical protein
MPTRRARLLILCKTYPSPSSQYVETSCVAAMEETGQLVRLYPVPFRLMQDEAQFKKWQWIEADVEKARKDRRPESQQIRVDNLQVSGDVLSTANDWAARRGWLDRLHLYTIFEGLEGTRASHGVTVGLLKPEQILSLEMMGTLHRFPEQWLIVSLPKMRSYSHLEHLRGPTAAFAVRDIT